MFRLRGAHHITASVSSQHHLPQSGKYHSNTKNPNFTPVGNGQGKKMFVRLVAQLADREGITEKLNADNQLEWVRLMKGIGERVTEIVNKS